MKRVIHRLVLNRLSKDILAQKVDSTHPIVIDVDKDGDLCSPTDHRPYTSRLALIIPHTQILNLSNHFMKKLLFILMALPLLAATMVSCSDDDKDVPEVNIGITYSGATDVDGTLYTVQGDTISIDSVMHTGRRHQACHDQRCGLCA